ncbi:MAG: UTP--glucose-1-phosphate uridylyltransferase [Faecalibacterium sp.]|nr:UTP--glucose-1-phosphate uridylyltransferase [Ruminococcus sp.]MCM1393001.1 UTP--glucose-1-phosphate uridylyltransferase [Ruminococcus sp.]MCM1486511.1 UTP--glucose-1-phosphate uridylyltransferase [Faecalibacterium sp.]
MKIRKAIIPAAGLGTRVLPASKSIPKEMLNIVDKPAIQYIVEEAVEAGIEEILIITNRGKGAMEDHFDHSFELESNLKNNPSKQKIYEDVLKPVNMANIYFIRQKETKGLADAILRAKGFVGDEPFAILYGDDVIINQGGKPAIGQLCEAYEKYGKGIVGVKEVPRKDVSKYCSLDVTPIEGNVMQCHNIIEKPTEDQIISCYSILGRVVMPPEIFDIIERTPIDEKAGEVYFTDSMVMLSKEHGLNAIDFEGIRYDMGNKLGIMKANCEVALAHDEIGEDFKAYIKELAEKI